MSGSVKPAVSAIWVALGMAPPAEAIGDRYDFTLEDVDFTLSVAPNGECYLLQGVLGPLSSQSFEAADQLSRLMRIGLGLASFNRAALMVIGDVDDAMLMAMNDGQLDPDVTPVLGVEARIPVSDPTKSVARVQDVLQWRSFASDILAIGPSTEDWSPSASSASESSESTDYVVFQP